MNKITIIVPIFNDWSTLGRCIESLIMHVKTIHSILLVNDNPDNPHDFERKICDTIKGHNNFRYFRNDKNLGFLKTCNKAVFELDKSSNDILLLNSDTEVTSGFLEEMSAVLYSRGDIGIVCPRTNNAFYLSVPPSFQEISNCSDVESYKCFQIIKNYLPSSVDIPTALGFCMLIRRDLINKYGLFDEFFGKGYQEENDFSMRLVSHGYTMAASNRAFVFHHVGKSFSDEEKKHLNDINFKKLLHRYPFFSERINSYYRYQTNPVDYFSDELAGIRKGRGVLIYLAREDNIREEDLIRLINHIDGKSEISIKIASTKRYSNVFYTSYEKEIITDIKDARFNVIFAFSHITQKELCTINRAGPLIALIIEEHQYNKILNNESTAKKLELDSITKLMDCLVFFNHKQKNAFLGSKYYNHYLINQTCSLERVDKLFNYFPINRLHDDAIRRFIESLSLRWHFCNNVEICELPLYKSLMKNVLNRIRNHIK